jgi:hypothetical protein
MRGRGWRFGYSGLVVVLLCGMLGGVFGAHPAPVGAAASDRRFGLVADIGTRFDGDTRRNAPVGILAGSGATWAKEEFRWDTLEPSRGRWTWGRLDDVVNAERARNLEILGLLDYSTGWAVGEAGELSTAPPPRELWANYVAQTVGHFKDRVHVWEVWNEPNVPVFWRGSKEQYADLLRVTYDTIKGVDPGATVLGPAISGVDEDWLAAMPWDKMDAVSLHLYVPPAALNDQGYSLFDQGLPNLKSILARFPAKPIWITEFGFASQDGPDPWYVGDEGAQARYLIQQIAEMLASDLPIARIMPYVLNDHDGFELVHGWARPKPAYNAYRTATERLEGATGRGRIAAGDGVFAFRFERDGHLIDIVWAPNGGTASLTSGGDAEVIDLFGGTRTVARAGSAVTLSVNADPVYVIHAPIAASSVSGSAFSGAGQSFAQTGKAVRGPFLAYWQANGGLPIYGYPISDELVEVLEDGKPYLVQYFERARFEYHPESPAPNTIQLGQFGRRLHPLYPALPDCGCGRFFPETGHNIAGDFKTFWEQHGGLAQFGYPLTDPVTETLEDGRQYTVQWFERARFELHPELAAPNNILLGQFGRQVYRGNER